MRVAARTNKFKRLEANVLREIGGLGFDHGNYPLSIEYYAKAAEKYKSQFSAVKLFTIDDVFGGWSKATDVHFKDGGVFVDAASSGGAVTGWPSGDAVTFQAGTEIRSSATRKFCASIASCNGTNAAP